MDRALGTTADAIHRYEGTVNQFLGDGVMALFGAPLALEDHGLRAVLAALSLREAVADYSRQLRGERGVEIPHPAGAQLGAGGGGQDRG